MEQSGNSRKDPILTVTTGQCTGVLKFMCLAKAGAMVAIGDPGGDPQA